MSARWREKTRSIHDDTWQPNETVTIRTFFGSDDRQRVLSATHEMVRQDSGDMIARPTTYRAKGIQRTLAVTGWTLLDEDGQPLPFTDETLLNLPPEVADFIDGEIERDWLGLTALPSREQAKEEQEDRATFQRPGLPPPPGAQAGRGPHDGAGPDDPGRRGPQPEDAPAVEGLRDSSGQAGGVPGSPA